ncbi:YeeE/YedE thiosulfate transporter family protein [Prosthecobacter sp. SYSU 5D2]|uniref:YeeE/YedE thiosulfate transporter family protein n=1 Tax=Prosthecobacter sp. SYSU 5D2 TaxID=3134134 RepID=UPI0031FE6C72
MKDPGSVVKASSTPKKGPAGLGRLLGAVAFGLCFGFLLQKGGVAKYNVLVGQLLLQDFTVVKVMMTAVVVGMAGVLTLHHFAKVNLHIQPLRIGANLIGGLLFGAGFALLAYCPGTGAAALGQGSWDVLFGMAGLVIGSWIYAELSTRLQATVEKWGDKGKVTLPELFHLPRSFFIPGFILVLGVCLYILDLYTVR